MKKMVLFLLVLFGGFAFEGNVLTELQEKSKNYFSIHHRAKIQLLFNQPKYAPGDTALFTVAYLSASDLKPISGKELVHICFFDQSGKKVLTQWTTVHDGYASNQMAIPMDFSPGNYLLVAFTDWMKNFDQTLFFKMELAISEKKTLTKILPKDSVIFFPEGGVFVAGVENNIAIRYLGEQCSLKIVIREDDAAIDTLQLVRDSVSLFRVTPRLNSNIFAEILDDAGKRYAFPLPRPSGVSVQIQQREKLIQVRAEYSGNIQFDVENLYLAVFNPKGIAFYTHLNFDSNHKTAFFLPSDLPRGISQLVMFDSKFNLLTKRVIWISDGNKNQTLLENLQNSYATRQAVNINLKIKNEEGFLSPKILSCRVINNALFKEHDFKEMDWFTFQSDLSNTFSLKATASPLEIQDYLITQTCPWFDWDGIVGNNKSPLLFKRSQYLQMTGQALFSKDLKRVPDSTDLVFFLQKGLQGYETRTDSKGKFSFPLILPVTRPDIFFYSAFFKGSDMEDVSVRVDDPDSSVTFFSTPCVFNNDSIDQYGVYSSQKQLIENSYSFFRNGKTEMDSVESNHFIEEELNGADLTVNLNDYLLMPTMKEVVREILRAVEYRKVNGRDVVRVYTTAKKPNNHSGPLYVIDGQMTREPSYFLSLNPSDVISIKVVKESRKLFPLGKLGANGVIIVKTKLRINPVNERHTIDFPGLLVEPRKLYSDGSNPQAPDFRACLFWSGRSFERNEGVNILFKTSDDIGDFKIQVSGLTQMGSPFFAEQHLRVTYFDK